MEEGLSVEAARLKHMRTVDEWKALREAGVVMLATGHPVAVESTCFDVCVDG